MTADGHPAPGTGSPDSRTRYFFQIGFQRCGTTSIAVFLNRSGIPCVHHDRGRLARRMRVNLAAGRPPLAGYDHRYRAFTNLNLNTPDDYFDAFKHYRELRRAYGGRFILNTRPREHWVRSVIAHKALRGRRAMLRHYELRFGTTDLARVAECWREEWEEHHRRVRAEIPAEVLLEFDIESDPPERLCDFVGVPRTCARHWRRENPTMNGLGSFLSLTVPRPLRRVVPMPARRQLRRLLRAR